MSATMETVEVPAEFAGTEEVFRLGYRAGREMDGSYRLNMEAMRYEPRVAVREAELEAWTAGFRLGYLARRAAGELLRF